MKGILEVAYMKIGRIQYNMRIKEKPKGERDENSKGIEEKMVALENRQRRSSGHLIGIFEEGTPKTISRYNSRKLFRDKRRLECAD